MRFQELLNGQFLSAFAIFLGRVLPKSIGYRVGEAIALTLSSFKNSQPVRSLRANQWVASDMRMSAAELDNAVKAVYRLSGSNLYDYYHHLTRPKEVLAKVDFSAQLLEHIKTNRATGQGMLLVLPHTGNFDIAGMALAKSGLSFQVLSYPHPPGGYKLQNKIREFTGVETTPMSFQALHAAGERLRQGGIVITGIDRPLPDGNYKPRFFGRPAGLPVGHVRMALKTSVPVIVIAVKNLPNHRYLLDASEPIPMRQYPDRTSEIERNAETILQQAEKFIRSAPQQWLMFYPVWPEILNQVP